MQPFLSAKTKLKLKVFGWYQIIGGVAGVLITVWLLARTGQINGLILLFFLIAFAIYSFSFYCGRLLLNDGYYKGLNLSVINQAFQILHFAMLGYGYQYVSGSMIEIGISVSHGFKFNFNFALVSSWQFSIGDSDEPFIMAINIVAIYWLYYIEKLRTAIKQEQVDFKELRIADVPQDDETQGYNSQIV